MNFYNGFKVHAITSFIPVPVYFQVGLKRLKENYILSEAGSPLNILYKKEKFFFNLCSIIPLPSSL